MSIEDFKMYEEWSRYRENLKDEVVERPAPPIVLASWGRRFGAYLIDSILLSIPLGFYMFTNMSAQLGSALSTMSVDPVTGEPDQAGVESLVGAMLAAQLKAYLIFIGLAAVYYVVCHATLGQTPGKMALGIRLIKGDGTEPGWGEAIKRALINPLVYIVPVVGGFVGILNGLWPLWDERSRSLGDKVAGTLVVDA